MKVAIHQPHYLPWLGYMDKMAKVEEFVIMDMVQLEDKSYMCRNRILNKEGGISLLSIPCFKKGYREKKYKEIQVNNIVKWQKQHKQEIVTTYKYSPYLNEVVNELQIIFEKDYNYLIDVTYDSIEALKRMLNINTKLVYQSELNIENDNDEFFEKEERQSNDVLNICKAVGGTEYLTGRGASVNFLNISLFKEAGVQVALQNYECPQYYQRFSSEFVPNISTLDLLLNNGIEASRKIFWENVKKKNDFE